MCHLVLLWSFIILISLGCPALAKSQQTLWEISAKYYDFNSDQERSRVHFELITSGKKSHRTLVLTQTGHGQYSGHKNAHWTITSTVTQKNGLSLPLATETTINGQDGKILTHWLQTFDYSKNLITITLQDPQLKKKETLSLPLKGPTVDHNTLILFLEKFALGVTPDNTKSFYLLTPDCRLYKVNLKYAHEDTLDIGQGPVKAIKLRLIADMGVLDDMFDKFVSPTYVWMVPEKTSMKWVAYEGMETSAKSPRVKAKAQWQRR